MSLRWDIATSLVALVLAGAPLAAQTSFGPDLPPGFYGVVPAPLPGREAPPGVKRLALLYTGCIVGETEPCG